MTPCKLLKFLPAILLTLLLTCASTLARAQTFKVLHTFHGWDGASPEGALVRDPAGNLYSTTAFGGTGNCSYNGQQDRCGTAFMLNKNGKLVGVFSFNGQDGQEPTSGLLRDAAGNFYGATGIGGKQGESCSQSGCGLVYKFSPRGKETIIYQFPGAPGELGPGGPLVEDAAGNLYGGSGGGKYGLGAVFKIDPAGNESVLYSFTGGSDGCGVGPVILDTAGNVYGTSEFGGIGFCNSGFGVVFKIDPSGNETVLHAFDSGSDGANPFSVLLLDSEGNLYGTTQNGGTGQGCGFSGCGTVFELSPQKNGSWSETVLYSFCSLSECADGERPFLGPLVKDISGNLYGTTSFGGAFRNCGGGRDGCGTVFELRTDGSEAVLHSFTGGADGADPFSGLVMDKTGNLYGTAAIGGDTCFLNYTCGVVFEITP